LLWVNLGYRINMITLTIDGKELTTRPGSTILTAAREGGIAIPTLCYHEHLLPIGSCRLCLVEVEGYSEPMTACNTPAMDGINVTTRSEKLFRMRKEFLKLILASHPLDCPQCDKGGECKLQDLVYEHGIEKSDYEAIRTDSKEGYATPLIRHWELRCVLCGRCYRACREISGRAAIDIAGKGFEARIAATDGADCISCGECLSLCPVGALTEKMSPVKSRAWQSERTDTTCPHCGFGCRLTLNVCEGGFISKVVSETDLPPNSSSLCVRGRFGYDFVNHPGRVNKPYQLTGGDKKVMEWDAAVQAVTDGFRRIASEGKGIGFIVSSRATNEEMFLLARIAERFKDSRVATSSYYHTGKVAAAYGKRGIGFPSGYDRISSAELIIVAGADLLVNNHLLANKVRETVLAKGALVIVIDPLPSSLTRIADVHLQVEPGEDALLIDALSRMVLDAGGYDKKVEKLDGFLEFSSTLPVSSLISPSIPGGVEKSALEKAGKLIGAAKNIAVLFGSGVSAKEESLSALLNLSLLKGLPEHGVIIPIALQANARGAVSILGSAVSPEELLQSQDVSGLFIYEEDPFHFLNGEMVTRGLANKTFIAVCDILPTKIMDAAHLVIPSTAFAEKEGTVISGDGKPRAVRKAFASAPGGADFLKDLLGRLGGKLYSNNDELMSDLVKELLAKEGNGGDAAAVSVGRERFQVTSRAVQAASAVKRPYRLILRDLFVNHHLTGKVAYGEGVAKVQKEMLCISPEDAAALQLADGEAVCVESADGAVTRPVTVKAGVRKGVLECSLWLNRGEILALSAKPAKVIEVDVRKA
jgi:predicted molibdopterin-dependent oxidoreductase YjgC